jgi:hypothetical protein
MKTDIAMDFIKPLMNVAWTRGVGLRIVVSVAGG